MDTAIDLALSAHKKWVEDFVVATRRKLEDDSQILSPNTCTECYLGQWLATKEAKLLFVREGYEAIVALHEQLYLSAKLIAQSLQREGAEKVLRRVRGLEVVSEQLVGLLEDAKNDARR